MTRKNDTGAMDMPPPSRNAPFDPRLKLAIEDLKAVATKHGIAAVMAIASDTHSEFAAIFPAWSGIYLEGEGVRIRFAKDEKAKAAAAAHVIIHLRDLLGMNYLALEDLFAALRQGLEAQGGYIKIEEKGEITPDMAS